MQVQQQDQTMVKGIVVIEYTCAYSTKSTVQREVYGHIETGAKIKSYYMGDIRTGEPVCRLRVEENDPWEQKDQE